MIADTELLCALPVAVYITDADGRITFYNEAAAQLWGYHPPLGSSQWCGSWKLYWPDGRALPHEECPMAQTLKTGRPVRGVEAVLERPDGRRIPFLPYPTLLRDGEGRITGAMNLMVDISDKKLAETESARLAAIVSSSDDAIVSKTLEGQVVTWNAGAARIFGYDESEMVGRSILLIIPPELHQEEERILATLKRGEHIDHYETVRMRKDGQRIDISLTVSPLIDRQGRVIGVSKVARDITERKRAEALQRLLFSELDHRVKNTLAMVQAIAAQSLRRSRDPQDFVAGFTGRVQALAKAHELLTRKHRYAAELHDLLREQVLLGSGDDTRITLSGPLIMLGGQAVVHMALLLHELATNARKYGALSVSDGRLSVTWEVRSGGGRILSMTWKESGGPRVEAPSARGFGTTLIEQTLRAHDGEAVIRYGAEGVRCEVTLPLPAEDGGGLAAAMAGPSLALDKRRAEGRRGIAGKRILVVEDEPLVAMELESILTASGCTVLGPAGSLEQARRLLAEAECDLALVDANLSGHPVDDLVASLARKSLPFAFTTGYGREALPIGFQDRPMIGKPFSQDQLLAMVGKLLAPMRGESEVISFRQRRS